MKVWKRIRRLIRRILLLDDDLLCDTCRYDYGEACRRPERPNAVDCDDYEKA